MRYETILAYFNVTYYHFLERLIKRKINFSYDTSSRATDLNPEYREYESELPTTLTQLSLEQHLILRPTISSN
jgi:hypothetical protein